MANTYYKDSEDEALYLDMLEEIDFKTAQDIYCQVKDEVLNSYLSPNARKKSFSELSYKNLRYIILGCKNCTAETKVKALATFIYRASLQTRLSALVSNERLLEMLHKNIQDNIASIYEMSGLEYDGA